MFSILHPIKSFHRICNMGVYSQLSKIETLIEANTKIKSWGWTRGWISIEQLPDKMKEAMIQMGYNKEAPLFGVGCRPKDCKEEEGKIPDVFCIAPPSKCDWIDLIYKDVDRNWRRYVYLTDDIEKNKKEIDVIYKELQKLFLFLNIYIKNREQLRKIVEIEYDEVKSSLDSI